MIPHITFLGRSFVFSQSCLQVPASLPIFLLTWCRRVAMCVQARAACDVRSAGDTNTVKFVWIASGSSRKRKHLLQLYICLILLGFSDVCHSACVWPTALKPGCITNFDMLFSVTEFTCLSDEYKFMLISILRIWSMELGAFARHCKAYQSFLVME